MCLIAFAYRTHPKYKLILAANRDEFYKRPTRPARFWTEEGHPDMLAGKDLEAGGTWMGISKKETWGALTNYRDFSEIKENPPSRGELVLNYLDQDKSPAEFLENIKERTQAYNGFNILLGDADSLLHYSNHSDTITEVEPGIHGVSNALLDTPWTKLEQAKSDLSEAIKKEEPAVEDLFSLLKNDTTAPDAELPETGLPYELEKAVSSVFIKTDNYGTRCSTVLLIDHDGKCTFTERRYDPSTSAIIEENSYSI